MSDLLEISQQGAVLVVRLNRVAKRNALSDALVEALRQTFTTLPQNVAAVLLCANGEHFCAGLDLNELRERDAVGGLHHSRGWHAAFNEIQFGRVPVVAVLHGAVVGGGLELATCAHVRVAEESTLYALPEGSRGIFLGGGGSVRVGKLIGAARVTDMMLTGRTYSAQEGYPVGFSQYVTENGAGFAKGLALAQRIAENAPMTNYALMHALPRIVDQPADHGYFTESLMAGIAQSADEAKARVRDFLERGVNKVKAKN